VLRMIVCVLAGLVPLYPFLIKTSFCMRHSIHYIVPDDLSTPNRPLSPKFSYSTPISVLVKISSSSLLGMLRWTPTPP